jgi:hypothetical protein
MSVFSRQQHLSEMARPLARPVTVDLDTPASSVRTILGGVAFAVLLFLGGTLALTSTNWVRTDAAPTVPALVPVAVVPAVPAASIETVPQIWAFEREIDQGTVPAYTMPSTNSTIDINAINPESGQGMSGVIYP